MMIVRFYVRLLVNDGEVVELWADRNKTKQKKQSECIYGVIDNVKGFEQETMG